MSILTAAGSLVLTAPPAQAADGDLVIELTGVNPAVLSTGDTLTLTGRLVNTTTSDLAIPEVRLLLQKHVPASTAALDSWLDGRSDLNVTALTGWNPAGDLPIPALGSVPFTIALATDITFSALSTLGPRGVEIEARSGTAASASVRTTVLWYPESASAGGAADLTVVVPLTPTAQEWRTALEEGIPVGDVAAPRLLEVLEGVGPTVSIAVDPVLLEDNPPGELTLGEISTPGATGTVDPESARNQLLTQLAAPESRRDLISMGYADADLGALAEHAGGALWAAGAARARTLFTGAGLTVENIVWPGGSLTTAGAALLQEQGTDVVVIADAEPRPTPGTAQSALVDAGGGLNALMADDELSASLTDPELSGVEARQALLARSSVVTRMLPRAPGSLLLTLPRDLQGSDVPELAHRLAALSEAPWLQAANMHTLLGRTDSGGATVSLPTEPAVETIDPTALAGLLSQREVVEAYADAAGTQVSNAYAPSLLSPLSAAFTESPSVRGAFLAAASDSVAMLDSSIRVESSSNVLLIYDAGEVPVTITNDLPVPADVVVELVPGQIWLKATDAPSVRLAPGESTTLRIPITAVANGDADIAVHVLSSLDGRDLAEPASFSIRVRADWETIGTAVVAGLLLMLFIFGLVRTIRRGGRRKADV